MNTLQAAVEKMLESDGRDEAARTDAVEQIKASPAAVLNLQMGKCLGDERAAVLSGVLGPSKVKALLLNNNQIGDIGTQALAEPLGEGKNKNKKRSGTSARRPSHSTCRRA